MREINFRVYRDGKMDYYPEIYPIAGHEAVDLNNALISSEGEIWMQYTGIDDKNENEIYEDDIIVCVAYNIEKFVVKYDCNTGGYYPFVTFPGENKPIWSQDFIVIGNIHENPELIDNKD
jgi:hypothetical protein